MIDEDLLAWMKNQEKINILNQEQMQTIVLVLNTMQAALRQLSEVVELIQQKENTNGIVSHSNKNSDRAD